jgi:hypothetical protein
MSEKCQQATSYHSKRHYYSITSSARCWRDRGTSRPSSLAVLRLITSSKFVGCNGSRSPARRSSKRPARQEAPDAMKNSRRSTVPKVSCCGALRRSRFYLMAKRQDLCLQGPRERNNPISANQIRPQAPPISQKHHPLNFTASGLSLR